MTGIEAPRLNGIYWTIVSIDTKVWGESWGGQGQALRAGCTPSLAAIVTSSGSESARILRII